MTRSVTVALHVAGAPHPMICRTSREIVYIAAPGAIVANTTVLSATTGLSFDAPFVLRPAW